MFTCTECLRPTPDEYLEVGVCIRCRSAATSVRIAAPETAPILMTTEAVSPFPIQERLGIVGAECILGVNFFKDVGSAVRDVIGGRNTSLEDAYRSAREAVLVDLQAEAEALGATFVIAVDLKYSEISGGGKSMVLVAAVGTAIRVTPQN